MGHGAELYTNDEFFIWSWSSCLSMCGMVKNDLASRFPICMLPQRTMFDWGALHLKYDSAGSSGVEQGSYNVENPEGPFKPFGLSLMLASGKVWEKVNEAIAQLTAWSLKHAMSGIAPSTGLDMFNIWLDMGEKWDRTEAEVQRIQQSSNLARKQWTAVQAKTLKSTMSETRYRELLAKRVEAGLTYKSEDFPDDEEETNSTSTP